MRKIAYIFIVITFFIPSFVQANNLGSISFSHPQELTNLIDEGVNNNKEIHAIKNSIAAFKEDIVFAGSLPDPVIGIGLLNLPVDSFRFDEQPMTQKQFFFSQTIPWFGKLDLKTKKAVLILNLQEAVLKYKLSKLIKEISINYYQLGFVFSAQKVNKRLYEMVKQMRSAAEVRYASGKGLQQDVLMAQVELTKLIEEEFTLQKKQRIIEDRLNILLNRIDFSAIIPSYNLNFFDTTLKPENLLSTALMHNPQLFIKKVDVDLAMVDIEIAKKEYYPNVNFKIAYGQRDEDMAGKDFTDFFSTSVAFNIPLWKKNRQDRNLASAIEKHNSKLKLHQNFSETLTHKLSSISHDIKFSQKNYKLLKDAMMVQASQLAGSSFTAYSVGKIEFNTMINAQIRLLSIELQVEKYFFEIFQQLSELQELLGTNLPGQNIKEIKQ